MLHQNLRTTWPEAYQDGFKTGAADRRIGAGKSSYGWWGVDLDPKGSYSWHYSRGYRDGYLGRASDGRA